MTLEDINRKVLKQGGYCKYGNEGCVCAVVDELAKYYRELKDNLRGIEDAGRGELNRDDRAEFL